MVQRSVKSNGLVVDVGENGSFGALTKDKRGREGDFLAQTKRGIILAENTKHPVQELEI